MYTVSLFLKYYDYDINIYMGSNHKRLNYIVKEKRVGVRNETLEKNKRGYM